MGEDRGMGVHQENRVQQGYFFRGTQCQFLENICLEDDLRTRIFGTFVVKFLACLAALFLAEIFEKVSFDPYNFWITRLSTRISERMKNL